MHFLSVFFLFWPIIVTICSANYKSYFGYLRFTNSIDIEVCLVRAYQQGIIWERKFSILSCFFSCFLLICKLHKLCLFTLKYVRHGRFEVFYKKCMFNYNLLVLAIVSDVEIIRPLSVNYIFRACKSYSLFEHFQNIGQYLYLSVFSKH